MDLNSVFGGDTLKAADLQGGEPTVVIANVEMKKFDNGNKLIIKFQGKKKALVCNKTNAKRIGMLHGNNTDLWVGKEIMLCVDWVDFQGSTVEAIRVKPPRRREAMAQNGDNEFATRQGPGVVMHERVPQSTDRVPGAASTSVDLDQDPPF